MDTYRHFMYQGILLVGLSILVIGGNAAWVWGESSFSGVEPFARGFTVNSGMSAYDPRTLIVNFGEPNEVTYITPPGDQVFDFTVFLEAPVDIEPDTVKPQSVPDEEPSAAHDRQPGAVPEPSSILLLALGLLLIVHRIWREHGRNRG